MHVMDIAQNAVAAGAANTRIILRMDTAADRLELTVEDDGRGMTDEQARAALDPFYTSRTTRKVGLGLPLLRLTAQLTGGDVAIESSPGKGTRVTAWFGLSHIDRPPLGDMAGTISALMQENPERDFCYELHVNDQSFAVNSREIKQILGDVPLAQPEVALFLREYIEENSAPLLEKE